MMETATNDVVMCDLKLSIFFTLIAVATGSSDLDYSPCTNDGTDGEYIIQCTLSSHQYAADILAAFRRNRGNGDITSFYMYNSKDMTDDIMDEILDIMSPSIPKLKILGMVRDQLTRVPPAVQNFTSLDYFSMSLRIDKTVLPAGSLTFSCKLDSIVFLSGHLVTIEPGAFQGDFSTTDIHLGFNYITSFEEDVFKPILESKLSSGKDSKVSIENNPIPCDCNLAWILRDNRHLLPYVHGDCLTQSGRVNFENVVLGECP